MRLLLAFWGVVDKRSLGRLLVVAGGSAFFGGCVTGWLLR